MKKIVILLLASIIVSCSTKVKEVNLSTSEINVLWQDASRWDSTTARKVAILNPDKFIINIDGPGSDSTNPHTGPSIDSLVKFIRVLTKTYNYKGVIAMHPDCAKGEYESDWMGKGNLPNIDSLDSNNVYKVYVNYFIEINNALKQDTLLTFTELLIETENSFISSPKAKLQKPLFEKIKLHLNDSTIKLSATSDLKENWVNFGVDYFYVQMYDICYLDSLRLCGPNYPAPSRVKELVRGMDSLTPQNHNSLNNVYFIFSYAPNPSPTIKNPNPKPHADAPMFGEKGNLYWYKNEFTEFTKSFKSSRPNQNVKVGIWHCESPIKEWNI